MKPNKIVIFNGPPGSGKSEAAKWSCLKLGGVQVDFKQRLLDVASCMSGMDEEEWYDIYDNRNDPSRPRKETPLEPLGGLSQRQLLIKISEEWMKPTFGQDVFGKALVNQIKTAYNPFGVFFSGDGGFKWEVAPVVEHFGKENVMLVRIFRKGCSFDGDSRNYLPLDMFDVGEDLYNNSTLEVFRKNVVDTIRWFVEGDY